MSGKVEKLKNVGDGMSSAMHELSGGSNEHKS